MNDLIDDVFDELDVDDLTQFASLADKDLKGIVVNSTVFPAILFTSITRWRIMYIPAI